MGDEMNNGREIEREKEKGEKLSRSNGRLACSKTIDAVERESVG